MIEERLAVRIGLRLRPLRRHGLLRWALHSGAALAFALPLLLFAPARLAHFASPLHMFPLPTTGPLAGLVGATGVRRLDIPVGLAPSALAINPVTAHLFVANTNDDTVSVMDTHHDAVIATVPVGRTPVAVAISSRTGRVYVANSEGQTVSVLEHDGRTLLPLLALASWRR